MSKRILALVGIVVVAAILIPTYIGLHRENTPKMVAVVPAPPPPFTCAVIGDSITDMVQAFLPECDHNTKVGISSAAVLARVLAEPPRSVTVVSAGSNDPTNPRLAANLAAIRAHGPVIWIVPSATAGSVAQARRVVLKFVADHQEPNVQFTPGCCGVQARVHPIRPREIAAAIRQLPIWRGKK
jgi:hypothetical protein